MADWVIRSKLAPSVQLRWLIDRDNLVDCLERVLEARAAVLHAPAGYGKTSLLALWRRLLADKGVPVAWLSLDDHDRDPLQFPLHYVDGTIDVGFYSRLREINPESSFSVIG